MISPATGPLPPLTHAHTRQAFAEATAWFLQVLDDVPADAWSRPGLGEWTVRDLAGHTGRAFITIETYLADPPSVIDVPDVVTYFVEGMRSPGVNASVAERGRSAGAALGDQPAAVLRADAERVMPLVDATPDDAPCGSVAGGLTFGTYLASRVFELTVHTSDLCVALGRDDQPPPLAARVTLGILAELAARGADPRTGVLALTGRTAWPAGSTVLG